MVERQPMVQPSVVATAQTPLAPTADTAAARAPSAPQAQNDNKQPPQIPPPTSASKVAPPELRQQAAAQPEAVKPPTAPLTSPPATVSANPQSAQVKQSHAVPSAPPPPPSPPAVQTPQQAPIEAKDRGQRQEQQNPQRATPDETRAKGDQMRRAEERPNENREYRPAFETKSMWRSEEIIPPQAERATPPQQTTARAADAPTKTTAAPPLSFHDRVVETVKQTERVQDVFTKEKEKTCRDTCTSGGDCTRCGAAAAMQRMLANLQP
jgi:hypothetical protein